MTFDGFWAIGVDPGPVPGIVVLGCGDGRVLSVSAYQCTAADACLLLGSLLPSEGSGIPSHVQIETFVVRRVAGKSGHAGAVTRNLIGAFETTVGFAAGSHSCRQRSAGQVKPWATDARLSAVKVNGSDLLAEVSAVGRHARDAARHALFCAVKDGGIPDPLSKR